jgi:hypothetical protein
MKTLFGVLIVGALSATGALAEAPGTSSKVATNDSTIATPQIPFRPVQKRPTGARTAAAAEPRVNTGTPQVPFRPYQKRPTGAASKNSSAVESRRGQ